MHTILVVLALGVAACSSVPDPSHLPTQAVSATPTLAQSTDAAPSPTVLPNDIGVAVGATIDCSGPGMKRHCDTWMAAALEKTGIAASSVKSSAIHVAWSTVMRTMELDVAVELHKMDGSTEFVPLFCGPLNWAAICDTSDVVMPAR